MRRYFWNFFICCFFLGSISVQGRHLLISQIGEGASVSRIQGVSEPLKRASFLPLDSHISVKAKSGLETLSAGYQFRFGADTNFTLAEGMIHLHDGSIMIQSRKIGNNVIIQAPESKLSISGVGTSMFEVDTNGGLKVIGVLGRMVFGIGGGSIKTDLLAGELTFVKPGESGFGEKTNVNLAKVLETSFLLSGFKNNSSFQNSLASIVRAQKDSLDKIYAAEVGVAKDSVTSEILPFAKLERTSEQSSLTKSETPSFLFGRTSYSIPKTDPLSELLGRSSKRPDTIPKTTLATPPVVPRPLPGTLLRLKN